MISVGFNAINIHISMFYPTTVGKIANTLMPRLCLGNFPPCHFPGHVPRLAAPATAPAMALTTALCTFIHAFSPFRYLSAYLSFFCEQLRVAASVRPAADGEGRGDSAESTTGGRGDRLGPFCIQGMGFVGNVVGCSSYREEVLRKVTRRGNPQKRTLQKNTV